MAYAIYANRAAIALYLHWQFGARRAVAELRNISQRMPEVPPHLLFNGHRRFTSRRQAERVAASMSRIVGYQEGRLRRPLTGGAIFVREE